MRRKVFNYDSYSDGGSGMEGRKKLMLVLQELEKIPKIKGNLRQNLFRGYYYWGRMHDLKEGRVDKSETFHKALQMIRKDYPDFTPSTDVNFFTGYKTVDDFLKGVRIHAQKGKQRVG